ncbi:DUF2332 domain-containing protein [uncultured Phycicoccus sp.]|uniref:DUF2332 domain-containing protein n=1 Tax=uncultured Phycicoccus sp. TaxID=661422 RepID=UPI002610DF9A|nr:DUF2332 domain-containing protein [uncultured Phycicoccus sp.]
MSATLSDRLRAHFGHRDHLYGVLLAEMADDWDGGGVTRELFEGWEDAEPRQVPQLRALAGLFRILLRGDAPQLAPFYASIGGDADPEEAWAAVRPLIAAHVDELREALAEAPQTNEPARTVALLVGVSEAVRRTGLRRVRLLEPGASAGLGLLVDRYRFVGDGWSAGPGNAALVVDGCGAAGFVPEPFEVVWRRGCDVAPVDASSEDGATYLRSFVWPWMLERHGRLDGALATLREEPVVVDRARAAEWVERQLAEPVADDVLTVVWHSVTRMYWPPEETREMTAAIDAARARMPLAHVAMEAPWGVGGAAPAAAPPHQQIELDGEVLGTCAHHGPPVELTGR